MVKRIFGFLMLLCAVLTVGAQGLQEFPLDKAVRHGKLPNGLNYYILHNEEPKGHANFYIAQKVGSTLEKPEQLGLAHFLEHMCFNGIKSFPHDSMLNYLQNKGIGFGSDINAYTGFDETVYNINNIPTSDQALMDSTLLILHDWSCDLQLADDEIDAERGVIFGEYTQRNDAGTRSMTAVLPQIYDEYQYHQMPIGSMDIVMHFPYDALRSYYHTWYRPDQQGIVIVGDIDVDAMEAKVKALFEPIPMPEGVPERTYPTVSDNKGIRFATFEDPELEDTRLTYTIKLEKVPFEVRNTVQFYLEDNLVQRLIANMINGRLRELRQKPDCKFAVAGVYFSDFWVSKTKAAFNLVVIDKDDLKAGFQEAYDELVRSCRTGFTDSELGRAKDEMLSSFELRFNERDKTNNNTLAKKIIRHFIDNEPYPGIAAEYELVKGFLPNISAAMLNQYVAQIIQPDNQVVVIQQRKADGKVLPTKDEIEQIITGSQNKQFEAYVDDVIAEPLITKMPKPGKIKKEAPLTAFGATEFTLSNGAKVYLKTTDFTQDQVQFTAVSPLGMLAFPEAQSSDVKLLSSAVSVSKLGKFSQTQLQKALAGRQAMVMYGLDKKDSSFQGFSTGKDLETLMQLIYLNFTNVQPDPEAYKAYVAQATPGLIAQEQTPDYAFGKTLRDAWYDGNIYAQAVTLEDLNKADYERMLAAYKQIVENAANYTFIFVGNVDAETLKPLLEKYIASLPGNAKKLEKRKNADMRYATGQIERNFKQPVESAIVKEFVALSGDNLPFNVENNAKLSLMSDVLQIVFTKTLREELGGTYGADTQGAIDPTTGQWVLLWSYDTNEGQAQALEDRATAEVKKLMETGAEPETFQKVKANAIQNADLANKKNGTWLNRLISYALYGFDSTQMKQAYQNITLDDLNAFMKALYNGQNRVEVTMTGVVEKK